MADLTFEIKGLANLERILYELDAKTAPKNMQNIFKSASKPMVTAIKAGTPRATGKTRTAVKIVAGRGSTVMVGFKKDKRPENRENMPAYWRAYYNEFGTLENRDPGFSFATPRQRRKVRGKKSTIQWKGGIKAKRFFRNAVESTIGPVISNIESAIEKVTTDIMKRNAYKQTA